MKDKPLMMTFYALAGSLRAVHMDIKADVDRLHDIWKMGAPTPSSRVMQPKIYDPRLNQVEQGNREKRIILPNQLRKWLKDVLARRGMAVTEDQAMKLLSALRKASTDVYKGQR